MIHSKSYKIIEMLLLFILIPVSYFFTYSPIVKISIGVVGFMYALFVLAKIEKQKFSISKQLSWQNFWKTTALKLLVIAIITIFFVWFTGKENLFLVVINKPKMWLVILFFYSLFSVYPQELIYRTFFFERYKNLFTNHIFLMVVNAFLFCLGHLFFKNTLVLVITFIGGIIFAITYQKTNSTLLVSIEHAIYGCWLFTVGMGGMLGFPS